MCTSFLIQDINKKGCITVGQALNIGQNFSQYMVDESIEEYDKFLEEKIDNFECILLGKDEVSARGFEISYDNRSGYYGVRIFSPSSIGDYISAFDYIKKLCVYLENDRIVTEDNETYTVDNIDTYNYKEHIMQALKASYDEFKKIDDYVYFEIKGLYRPVAFNETILEDIINGDDAAEHYSRFITELQHIDAYSAKQNFFKNKSGAILCAYTLTETVPTIFPYKPLVEYEYKDIVKNEDVELWVVNIIIINGDPNDKSSYEGLGQIDYKEFIKRLPKEKYSFLDAKYILVEALNRQELEKILNKE